MTPTVSSIALTSSSGSDGIYALGDVVQATVTFSEAVDISGTPQLELDFDGTASNPDRTPRSATCATGTNTTTMVCSYTVAEGDLAPSGTAPYGIAIEANKLTGGTITATGTTTAAVLTHSAVAGVFGHKVDGIRPTLLMTGYDAPRTFVNGWVHLSFSEPLRAVDHDKITIHANGVNQPTASALVNGVTVAVALMTNLLHTDMDITVALGAGAVEDVAGNGILAVGPIGVTNTVPAPSCAMQRVGGYLLGEHLTSANGKIKATWTLPTDCTFEFEIKVEWWLLFDVEAGTDGGNNIWNGAWDEYRTATCEESPIVTSCTMGSDLHAGQRYAVRVYTIETSTGDARSVSNEVWTVEGASASPVTGLTATADNSSCTVVDGRESTPVELTWDAVPGVSSYQIWTEGGQHDFTDAHSSARVAATSVSGTSHTDSGVKVTGSKYLYVVLPIRGGNPDLNGDWDIVEVYIPGPERPRNINVNDDVAGDQNFKINWRAPQKTDGCSITGYVVQLYKWAPGASDHRALLETQNAAATDISAEFTGLDRTHTYGGREYGAQYLVKIKTVTAHGHSVPAEILFTDWAGGL